MHQDFAKWYSAVDVAGDPTQLDARWAGVEDAVEATKKNNVEALLRLALGSKQQPAADDVQRFDAFFRAKDSGYGSSPNARERQVLAAAVLAHLLKEGNETSAFAATAICTTAMLTLKPDLPMQLDLLAQTSLVRLSQHKRKRPTLASHTSTDAPKMDFTAAAAKAQETQNWSGAQQGLAAVGEVTRAGLKSLAQKQASFARDVDAILKVQDEELQMLWWLVGNRSWTLGLRFDEIPLHVRAFMCAEELAQGTTTLPEPASISALLRRTELDDTPINIVDAVNAGDETWQREILKDESTSPVTMPLHSAIKRKLETGAGDDWVAGWSSTSQIERDRAIGSNLLSLQFYRERLLFKFR